MAEKAKMVENTFFKGNVSPECYIFTTDAYDPENERMKQLKLTERLNSPTKDGEKVKEFLINSCGMIKERITLISNRSAEYYNK